MKITRRMKNADAAHFNNVEKSIRPRRIPMAFVNYLVTREFFSISVSRDPKGSDLPFAEEESLPFGSRLTKMITNEINEIAPSKLAKGG
jgi:hypothetical protein